LPPSAPWIAKIDPSSADIQTRINGKVVQFISGVMTLEPSYVIATGTLLGMGPPRKGDVVEVEIEGIGVMRNFVV
jgi:2-keto-4-pentenoate hydratase/2-oxohepta-3-ene-1,7-dioic acid hydratase in catechol pathway